MVTMKTKPKASRIVIISAAIFTLIGALLYVPILIHQFKILEDIRIEKMLAIKAAKGTTIQEFIELRKFRVDPLPSDVLNTLLPFESISLERTPCLGRCPVYKVTYYRNGTAILETESFEYKQRKTFTGSISESDFARLTQLSISAKKIAQKSSYDGQWTDNSTAIIRTKSAAGEWEVSDNGEVSPPEIWVLAKILHFYKENTEWSVGPIYPL
jgi:hypothetical protein